MVLPTGHPTIHRIARLLGVPIRTLQRRLHSAGFAYGKLVEEVRFEESRRLLKQSNLTVAKVSEALGFRDPSNFSRAFLRWTGMSPKQYQRRFSAVRLSNEKRAATENGTE